MVDSVKIAKALSDPIRYQIMMMLVRGEGKCCPATTSEDGQRAGLCNCDIMADLDLIQSRVSYHMKELVDAGLVIEEPFGRWKYYYLNSKTMREYIEQLNKDFSGV
jgi:ArsR family transcriptional regulator